MNPPSSSEVRAAVSSSARLKLVAGTSDVILFTATRESASFFIWLSRFRCSGSAGFVSFPVSLCT